MIFCASASENQVQGNGIFTSTLIYHHEKAHKLLWYDQDFFSGYLEY